MVKHPKVWLAAWALSLVTPATSAPAVTPGPPASSFTGTFTTDSDEREFFFTLAAAGPVTIRTYSYAGGINGAGATIPAGGFDPTLSLYDSSGALISVNQDGGCGLVGKDPVTSSCWDAFLPISLPAGTYRVVLTQSTNLPAGPQLSDSFIYNPNNLFNNSDLVNNVAVPPYSGQPNFTQPPGTASAGFWDFFPNRRTPAFALDIEGATSALAPSNGPTTTLPYGLQNVAYPPASLTVQGGTGAAYVWTPPASGLPPGMSLSPAGVLSGTPTAPGIYTFTATATDGVQALAQTVTIAIYGPLAISTATIPGGFAGQSYGPVQLAVSGGSGQVTWTATGLSGLTLSPAGVLSGTVPPSTFSFNVLATDTVTGQTAAMGYSVSISVAVSVPVANLQVSGGGALPEVALGSTVSATFGASGGTPPYRFASSGLPPGLSIGATTGVLGGTAASAGNFPFTITVSDSGGQSSTIQASLSVLGFTSGALPAASTTAPYSFTFAAAGGTGSYSFSASGLPAGLSLSPAGALTGTRKTTGRPPSRYRLRMGW